MTFLTTSSLDLLLVVTIVGVSECVCGKPKTLRGVCLNLFLSIFMWLEVADVL